MSDSSPATRSDFRDLREALNDGLDSVRGDIKELGEKLSAHALEDADREGRVAGDLGGMRSKLDSLVSEVTDRHRFLRGWVGGILAVAIAAAAGFVIRSAIQVEVSKPIQVPPPPAAQVKP